MNRRIFTFAILIFLALLFSLTAGLSQAQPQNLLASHGKTLNPSLAPPLDYDFGDAPAGYFTLLCAFCEPDAAYHLIVPGLHLGNAVDAEDDGQPSIDADGDGDDEDGVDIAAPVRRGSVVELLATVTGNGILQGWVDFNGDGSWGGNEDQIMINEYLTTGNHLLSFQVPDDARLGRTYARFRFSTQPDLGYGNEAPDGEVEDYAVEIAPAYDYDYGDMPDEDYYTLLAHNGARHLIVPGIHLGREIDGEPDGQPGIDALDDDQQRLADEDGVTFTSALVPGSDTTLEVVASAWGRLDAFVDFDGDNHWTLAEQIFDHEPLVSGVNYLSFSVPASAATGLTYARFRFRQEEEYADAPYGEAINGEVEDYQVQIEHLDWGDAPDVDERPRITKLVASDGSEYDYFGEKYDTAIEGEWAVVGAQRHDAAAENAGAVYVFRRGGSAWMEHQKLLASDPKEYAKFGVSVAISGDHLIIGAPGQNAAYIFYWESTLSQWLEQQKLTGIDTLEGDGFGAYVSISGDRVVVGAYGHDLPEKEDAGAAYVFTRNGTNWIQQQKLIGSAPEAERHLSRVAIQDDTVVIGAPGGIGIPSGEAYIFEWNGSSWIEKQRIPANSWDQWFGMNVDISGDHIIIGNGNAHDGNGMAYLYFWNGSAWQETHRIRPGYDGQNGGVSISGDYVIVSYKLNGYAGKAFVHRWDGLSWMKVETLEAPDAAPGDWFGSAVAISGNQAIIGASGADDNGPRGGAAYIFEWNRDDDDYPTLFANDGARHTTASGFHLGSAADFESNGHPSPPGLGDDYNGFTPDDEGGISFTSPLAPGATTTLDVVAAMPVYIDTGYLDAWIDFNADGDWDDEGEQIFTSQFLQPGTNNLAFPVPTWAVPANQSDPTFARFRYSSAGGLPYYGPAADGEVEDYPVEIMAGPRPPDLIISVFSEEEVELSFDHVTEDMAGNPIDVTAYRWYRSNTPYADLGTPWQTWYKGTGFPAVIAEVVADLYEVDVHHFYKVVSVADGGAGLDLVSVPSNEVGEFEFALIPGSP